MQRQRNEKEGEVAVGDLQGDFQGGWSAAEVGKPRGESKDRQGMGQAAPTASKAL